MCLMTPARVIAVESDACQVEMSGRPTLVSCFLDPRPSAGDWVLVNGGTVVRRLDAERAAEIRRAIDVARPRAHAAHRA
jgi:hydrogenase assembly chaperone HypC/HupF